MSDHLHIILDLYDCESESLCNAGRVVSSVLSACSGAGVNVLETSVHEFDTGGFTASILLRESHINIHTWPERSFCSADIFVCAGDANAVERGVLALFGPKHVEATTLKRGALSSLFPAGWQKVGASDAYYEGFACSAVLVETDSAFQHIQIIENPRFGKVLLLDGDIQLATADEEEYHAALVHPPLLAHPSPSRVLVLGGGDGGALRQVVMHRTVRRIVLVEIDEEVIRQSKRHLPEVSQGAFDDPRVEIAIADAFDVLGHEKFDVVIADLAGPTAERALRLWQIPDRVRLGLSSEGFLSTHFGWWTPKMSAPGIGLPFPPQGRSILYCRWIESFACQWSFFLAWFHNKPVESVLRNIDKTTKALAPSGFSAADYRREVFYREGM